MVKKMYDLSGKIKQYFANKSEKRMLPKKEVGILLVLFGILFMVIRMPVDSERRITEKSQTMTKEESTKVDVIENTTFQLCDYQTMLEERTEQILSKMDGVGCVKVMITLKNDGMLNVEKDIETQKDSGITADASGGSQENQKEDYKESTCYYEDGSGKETPIIIQTDMPCVEGIFVVAQGGDDPQINLQILNACQALFGIEAHKIVIVKGNTSERSAE